LEWVWRDFVVCENIHTLLHMLSEWDETMAVETRGGAEAYLETLGEVLGLGCQWADFA
jgi:hypothetical protein